MLRLDLQDACSHLQVLHEGQAQDGDGNDVDEAEAAVERLQLKIRRMEAVIGEGFTGMTLQQAAWLAAHGLKERLMK